MKTAGEMGARAIGKTSDGQGVSRAAARRLQERDGRIGRSRPGDFTVDAREESNATVHLALSPESRLTQ